MTQEILLIHILNDNEESLEFYPYKWICMRDERFFVSKLTNIINSKQNIVIFYQLYYSNIHNVFLKIKLEKIISNINYECLNVKIVYITDITNNLLKYSQYIKVINIFNSYNYIYSKLKDNCYQKDKKIFLNDNTNTNTIKNYIKTKPYNKHNYVYFYKDNYKFIDINIKKIKGFFRIMFIYSENIYDWLYKHIYETKIIGLGRLKQVYGTCWFNSVFNSMILSFSYRKILKEVYQCWLEDMSEHKRNDFISLHLNNLVNHKLSIKYNILKLIEFIIINGNHFTNDMIMNFIAYCIKLQYENKINNFNINDINIYINGGCVANCMYVIYKSLFPKGLYYITQNDDINCNIKINPIIVSFIVINKDIKILDEEFYFNNDKYILESCVLLINLKCTTKHSICGFKTYDNKYYIYDSIGELYSIDWRCIDNLETYILERNYSSISFGICNYCIERE